jgi:hypothetical protein
MSKSLVALSSLAQLTSPSAVARKQEWRKPSGLAALRRGQGHQLLDEPQWILQQPLRRDKQVLLFPDRYMTWIADDAQAFHETKQTFWVNRRMLRPSQSSWSTDWS